mgnify:CR=1 FL=1
MIFDGAKGGEFRDAIMPWVRSFEEQNFRLASRARMIVVNPILRFSSVIWVPQRINSVKIHTEIVNKINYQIS